MANRFSSFQNCLLYQAKAGHLFFVHKDSKEISNREEIKNIMEYYVNNEQRRDSQQLVKFPIEESYLKEELLWYWETNQLYFADAQSKEIIMDFMGKGKTAL